MTGRNVAVGARTRAREGTSRGASWESNAPRRRPRAFRLVRRDVHTGVLRARRGDVRDARVGARAPAAAATVEPCCPPVTATRRARAPPQPRVPARRSRRDVSAPRDAARRADGARRRAVGSFLFAPAARPRAVAHARRAPRRGRAAPIRRAETRSDRTGAFHGTTGARLPRATRRRASRAAAPAKRRNRPNDANDRRANGIAQTLATRERLKATCKATFSTSFSSRRAGHPRVSEPLLKPRDDPRRRRTVARTVPEATAEDAAAGGPGPRRASAVRRGADESAARRARVRTMTSTPRSEQGGAFVARHALAEKAGGDGDVGAGGGKQPRRPSSRRALRTNRLSASDAPAARRGASIDVDRSRSRRATCRRVTRRRRRARQFAPPRRRRRNAPRRARRRAYACLRGAARECRATVCRETVGRQAETSMMSMSPRAGSTRLRSRPRGSSWYGASDDDASGDGGLDESFGARDRAFPGRDLGGVEGFVEAFESGNDALARSEAACGSRGFAREFGENRGGLPASRLEDRFASLGLGLAAER